MKSILIFFSLVFTGLFSGVLFYEVKVAAPRAKAIEMKQAKLKSQAPAAKQTTPQTVPESADKIATAKQSTSSVLPDTAMLATTESGAIKSGSVERGTTKPDTTGSRVVDVISDGPLAGLRQARSDVEIEEAVRLDIQRAVAAQVSKLQ